MLIWRLWNLINGYVIIIVEGYFLEKFINICTHRNIKLWNVKWQKNSRVSIRLSIDDFKQLKPVVRKTKCKVHIISKKGLPFILQRYKSRKAFIAGFCICVAMFFMISSFVWDITVTGNYLVSTEAILQSLEKSGVKQGSLKFKVNPDEVVDNVMLDIEDLARISILLRGTRIYVDVTERKKPPEIIDKYMPCDIVAKRDGVIYSIVAKEGLETVKIGDTVSKGQTLITGTIENLKIPENPPLMVHSLGCVKARTWYEGTAKVEKQLVKKRKTGIQKDLYSLILFSKKFKLFHSKIPYNNSEHIEVKKKLSLGADFALPIEWVVDEYYEYELDQIILDNVTAKSIATDNALAEVQKQLPANAEIIKKNISETQDDQGNKIMTVTLECIEDIGVTQRIGGT